MSLVPRPIDQAIFRNSFVDELSGDSSGDLRPRSVPGACYSRVEPTPVRDPHLLAWSEDLGQYLGLTAPPSERGPAVEVLGGNRVTPTMKPFAARYAGHQFGNWAGQLGDGRAISLGEVEASDGSSWEIQLKGAGLTPYSRRGDGRAVLRSSLREFLCSEAMHHLGVPTTRALSLVGTGETVVRDMFYSGDPQPEPGAVVARVAPTFIRFGNFEMMAASGESHNLQALAEYVIRHHFPEFAPGDSEQLPTEICLDWFAEVCRRTAVLMAHWMSVGFVHGVMNTDNLSILGLTVDYGPYGWLEPYDPDWTPNTTDFGQRRYAFGQQPDVALWNLMMLAQALTPLVPDVEGLESGLESYRTTFLNTQREKMLKKLGLTPGASQEEDNRLLNDLQVALTKSECDMTRFFRHLSQLVPALVSGSEKERPLLEALIDSTSYMASAFGQHEHLRTWFSQYGQRLRQESANLESIREGMLRVNPKYVLRNYLAQQAIEGAESGDLSALQRLMTVLKRPYDEQPDQDALAAKRPEWARSRPGCATLSCSS